MNDSRIAINPATTTSEEFAATLREPTFLVPFLGETIACKTAADAEAVKVAQAALNGWDFASAEGAFP
jgi:hypothetical protein